MSNYSKIYWLTRLDSINDLLITLIIIGILYSFFVVLLSAMSRDFDEYKSPEVVLKREALRVKFQNKIKWVLPLSCFCLLISVFLPTRNEALLIMAGGKTLDYVQSDTSLSKIPQQTTTIISQYLENALKEMKKEK